jgi:SpoVK/Ycf46/Vps4 family AAA+-type ATPase
MKFLMHLVMVAFIALLFMSAAGNAWSEKILLKLVSNPPDKLIINFIHIFVPVAMSWVYLSLLLNSSTAYGDKENKEDEKEDDKTLTSEQKNKIKEAMEHAKDRQAESKLLLSNVIGLGNVKKQVEELRTFIISQKKKKVFGLPTQNINLHLVFTGNPGTGKTMIAREIAKIYKNLGLLKKGHLVETDRAGLVGEYVGQTAQKTTEIVGRAMDGILFIDEAYSLLGSQSGQDPYGCEAIDTLLKIMEDKKGKFAVIVAGYPSEMEKFVNSNPGLKSRFARTLNFSDYSPEELLQIFELFCVKEGYCLNDAARLRLAREFVNNAPVGEKGFGNGRYVRNIFEGILLKQAMRTHTAEDAKTLQEIIEDDIVSFFARIDEDV